MDDHWPAGGDRFPPSGPRHRPQPPHRPEPQYQPEPPYPPGPGPVATGPHPTPPPPDAWQRPLRVEPVGGTPYALAILAPQVPTSGPAIGSLVCGIAGIVVAVVAGCLGIVGAQPGWGMWVTGAFAVLAGSLGVAGVGLGVVGIRQTRPPREPGVPAPKGRGTAVAGLVCGAVTAFLTFCSVGGTALIQYA